MPTTHIRSVLRFCILSIVPSFEVISYFNFFPCPAPRSGSSLECMCSDLTPKWRSPPPNAARHLVSGLWLATSSVLGVVKWAARGSFRVLAGLCSLRGSRYREILELRQLIGFGELCNAGRFGLCLEHDINWLDILALRHILSLRHILHCEVNYRLWLPMVHFLPTRSFVWAHVQGFS